MENKQKNLIDRLTDLAAALSMPSSGDDDEKTVPQVEQIDFDELKTALEEAVTALEEARISEGDLEAARTWLLGRVRAMQKAQAVLMPSKTSGKISLGDAARLPELIRCYEDEAARLRQSTPGTQRVSRANTEYLDYKI